MPTSSKVTKEERSWILQDFANSAYSITITTALLPMYFKGVVAKNLSSYDSTAYWGYANSIATFLIAVLAPILGNMADYKGYKKKFFNAFLFLAVISTALLATVGEGAVTFCLIIYVLSVIGSTGASIFYDSFLTDVTTDERMDMISSRGFGFGYIGGVIPFILSILLITFGKKIGISTVFAIQIGFIITALWWAVFSIPLIKNVHQVHYLEGSPTSVTNVFSKLLQTFKSIIIDRNLMFFFIAYFFYIDGVHTIIAMATPIGLDLGLDGNKMMIILIFIQFIAFPFALLYGYLSRKFGARTMILVGIITYTIISIFGVFISSELHFWILAFLVASAQGGIQALSRSYFGKLIPKERSAEYFGVFNIFGKISSIFGPLLLGIVTQITKKTQYGIFSLIVLFILGIVFFLKIDESKVHKHTEK